MAKVILNGHIIVPAADLIAIRQHLPEHIATTRAEPGCLIFQVEEDTAQPGRFLVYEEFRDSDAFVAHQLRSQDTQWGKFTQDIAWH